MAVRLVALALTALLIVPLGLAVPASEAKQKSKTKTVTRTFANDQAIDIITFETHSSQIAVSGLKQGKLLDVDVVLHDFNHSLPDDVNVLLVAPGGRNAIVMSDAGAANAATNLTLTLDDAAGDALPNSDALSDGTFRPTNHNDGAPDMFINPDAPTPSGDVALSTFNGINPNGTWTLYVYDDNAGDNGAFAGGWSLEIKAKVKKNTKK